MGIRARIIQGIPGPYGPTGPAGTIAIGAVTTLAPGENAIVENTGTADTAVLEFGIPQGATGAAGAPVAIKGAYSGATAYVLNDVVQNAGSSWVALGATTGNAPPTLPTTSNAYWELVAAKGDQGAAGAGSGDMLAATYDPTAKAMNVYARANHTGTQSADTLTDGTTNKAFLATERTKLSGIATSATANSADATLLARANHTGTQTASTISDFSTAADARVANAVGTSVQAYDAQLSSLLRQNSKSAAYTLVLTDGGKHILHPSADTTARIFTIPANSSVAFPIGTTVTFINQNAGGIITIAITTDTMRLAGTGATGSRALAANGIATAVKITSTEWIISGTGLT